MIQIQFDINYIDNIDHHYSIFFIIIIILFVELLLLCQYFWKIFYQVETLARYIKKICFIQYYVYFRFTFYITRLIRVFHFIYFRFLSLIGSELKRKNILSTNKKILFLRRQSV